MKALSVGDDHDVVRLDVVTGPSRTSLGAGGFDARTPFFALVERMRGKDVCDTCKKSRVLLRLGSRYQRDSEERPDPAVHCSCNPGGPAYASVRFVEGAGVVTIAPLLYFEGREHRMRNIAVGTRGVIREFCGPGNAVVALQFEGHTIPYLQNLMRLEAIVELSPVNDGGSL